MFPQTKYEVNSAARILGKNSNNAIGQRLGESCEDGAYIGQNNNINDIQPHEYGWTEMLLPSQDQNGYPPMRTDSMQRLDGLTIIQQTSLNMQKKYLLGASENNDNCNPADTLTPADLETLSSQGITYDYDDSLTVRHQPRSDRVAMQEHNKEILQHTIGTNSYATPKK